MEVISNDKLGYQSELGPAPVGQGFPTLTNDSSPARTSPARTVARVVQQGQQHTADALVRALTLLASTSHAPTLEDRTVSISPTHPQPGD